MNTVEEIIQIKKRLGALFCLVGGDTTIGFIETDPTVEEFIKNITEEEIEKWNSITSFQPKGTYNPSIPYMSGDLVTDNGSSYISLEDNNTAIVTDILYWQLFAKKGDPGQIELSPQFDTTNAIDAQGGKQINDFYFKKIIKNSRNLINPLAVDMNNYYQSGTKTIISNIGLNWAVTEPIPVEEGRIYAFSHESVNMTLLIGGYLVENTDTTAIDSITYIPSQNGNGVIFLVPTGSNIKYVVIDLNTTDNNHTDIAGNYQLELADFSSAYIPYSNPIEYSFIKQSFNPFNQWFGKKIFWFGTSIPAGAPNIFDDNCKYPNIISTRLGAVITNKSVPGSLIRNAKADGSPLPNPLLSFTNESATINYQNSIIDKLNTSESPDLIVLNFDVNDYVADQTDINNFATFDLTSEDRSKFMGAINFVLKRIYQVKPTQRILLLTHFTKASMTGGVTSYENVNKAIERVAEYWGLPVCKTYEKTGWEMKNGINILQTMCPDGIHPGSMNSDYSVQILSRIICDFILGI